MKTMNNTLLWKRILFRLLGILSFFGGIFALYDFGVRILPLFELFVSGGHDYFELFIVLTSFFLGALSLSWVGMKLIMLRSFSYTWLHLAVFPVAAWLQEFYDIGLIYEMDMIMSLVVLYLLIYSVILGVSLFVHKHWYLSLSHESMRHVGTVDPDRPKKSNFGTLLVIIILVGLLVLHPNDLETSLSMLFSPLQHLFAFMFQV